jgi:hypothetical protein
MDAAPVELPHHDGSALYVADEGATTTVLVRVPHGDGATRVWLRTASGFRAARRDRTTPAETWWRAGLVRHGRVTSYRFLLEGGSRGYRWLNGTGVHPHDVTDADDYRLTADEPPQDAIVYQTVPGRVAGHLDHIGALGVDTLYLGGVGDGAAARAVRTRGWRLVGGPAATVNHAGFTRPVWAWLRHPAVRLPALRPPLGVPRAGAEFLADTVRAFTAATSWRAVVGSWWPLGSPQTPRIRTVVGGPDLVEVAAGLLFTMPGTPMVFAGDEIGVDGEDVWHRPDRWHRPTLHRYRALAALRRAHAGLRRGGLRWVHAGGDLLAYLRESADERLLVLAARAPYRPLTVPGGVLGPAGVAPNVYGDADALYPGRDGHLTLPGDGPTFQVWQLA